MATIVVMAELMMETPMNEMDAITFFTRIEAPAVNCMSMCVCVFELTGFVEYMYIYASKLQLIYTCMRIHMEVILSSDV